MPLTAINNNNLKWIERYAQPTGSPKFDPIIRAAQLRTMTRFTVPSMAANVVNATIMFVILWPATSSLSIVVWTAVLYAYAAYALWIWNRRRGAPAPNRVSVRGIHRATLYAGLLGAWWGLLPLILFPLADHSSELLMGTLIAGMIGAGAFSLSTIPAAAAAYVLALIVGCIGGMVRGDVTHLWPLILLFCIYSGSVMFTAHVLARSFFDRVVAEELLKERGEVIEMLLREFEENGSDWLFELDAALRIVSCSPRMGKVTGMNGAELVGLNFLDLLTPQSREEVTARIDKAIAFQNVECTIQLEDAIRWWQLTASPIRNNGKVPGWRFVGSDITEEKSAKERIARMTQIEPLTELFNRTHFRRLIDDAMRLARLKGTTIALACLDLDHFKDVNDRLGHGVGDELLQTFASRLRNLSAEDVTVGRMGGDEFGILVECRENQDAVRNLLERCIEAVNRPVLIHGSRVRVGGTIGVAFSSDHVANVDELIRNTGFALNAAKKTGRGGIEFYQAEMHRAVEEKSALLEELHGAIEDDQFRLQYQPIIDTVSSKIVGFEALLRWNHPRLGILAPGRFIDIAESAGLIGPLGDWVLNQACRDAMDWPESMSVAVNISPAQFASNTLAASVKAALKHSGLSPRRLELEITEAVFIQREMMVEQFIHEMNRLGVGIALDDFGTGYSSLAYLTRFPVQKLKIDSSFISGKRAFRERNAIVAAIVGIARTLDMAVTAEGVEKDAELAWVSSLGCRLVQGYYFARPMDSENIASYIENFSFRHLRGKFKVV